MTQSIERGIEAEDAYEAVRRGVRVVDKVSVDEMEMIRKLYTRKAALKELVFALAQLPPAERDALYGKLVEDLAQTCFAFDRWWADHQATAGWPCDVKLEIDFQTCEIFTRD